ncbi:MAG TPA: DNA-3-methyladenine glycosylase I [Caulobacteraceae bacterium]|nr:DNA-3-methyladenine glycosylase I [Caulobacteraceae bacterium]
MRDFDEIWARAAERKGGDAALEALANEYPPKTPTQLAAIPDDRWLAEMTRGVFRAGFNWQVIDNKWPGFEAAFHGFDTALNAAMSEDEFDAHLKNAGIVRNGQKVASVRANGQFLVDLAREHGSAARFFAEWPDQNFVGLIELMKKRAARCAGETAMRFFRTMGKPSFITTRDVAAALVEAGVLEKPPSSRKDFEAVQAAFNAWSAATGRDLTSLSRMLALSTGPSYDPAQGRPPPARRR